MDGAMVMIITMPGNEKMLFFRVCFGHEYFW